MRHLLPIIFLLLSTIGKAQQTDSVEFRILDSLNFTPVLKGHYFLLRITDTLLSGTFSDGRVRLAKTSLGHGAKKIKFITDTHFEHIHTFHGAEAPDVQDIFLISRGTSIESVEVSSRKSLITSDVDKISYNVQLDPDSKFLSLLHLMQKLPLVSLGPNETPLLKGSSNFLVLLDNRKSSLFTSNNLREALKTIPAANVLRIEVMTDPPARYESEGYAGIINIVTLKRLEDGYNGSVNLNASNFISGGSASLNFRKGKFGLTYFGGLNFERTARNPFDSRTMSSSASIYQNGTNQIHNTPKNSSILLSYEIDSLNLVTANFSLSASDSRASTRADATSIIAEGAPEHYSFHLLQEDKSLDWDAHLSYQRNFRNNKSRMLSLLYRYNDSRNDADIDNITSRTSRTGFPSYSQDILDRHKESSIQIDYIHPLKKVTIETGIIYTHRDLHSDFNSLSSYGQDDNQKIIPQDNETMDYDMGILGIYNSYLLRLSPVSIRAGVRYEKTLLDGTYRGQNSSINQNYFNIVPSVRIRYQTPDESILDLGFNQRIRRPGIDLLNPFEISTAPGFIKSGNQQLKPVRVNNLSFGYSKYSNASITAFLNYSFSRNTIQSLTSQRDSLVLTSYQNIGQYQRIGTEINFEMPFSKKIDFSLDGAINYVYIKTNASANSLFNDGIEGFIYGYLTYKAEKGWRFIANGGFSGPTVSVQAKSNSFFYSSFGVSKQLFGGKGNASFRVLNPFEKYRKQERFVSNAEVEQITNNRIAFRAAYLSLFWRFGKLKKEVRKNKKSIQMDDKAEETGKIL